MAGRGALAAANIGVMQALSERGIQPYAVCGMAAGAWPAAMYMSGRDAGGMVAGMMQATYMGKRMLRTAASTGTLLRRKRQSLMDPKPLEHLLIGQLGQRMLGVCPKAGILLCRGMATGRKVIFSSRAFEQESMAMLSMQVSVSFAVRAAMTLPPFLTPLPWMGSLVTEEYDAAFAARQLLSMGAQRVLVILPELSPRHVPDALDLVGMASGARCNQPLPREAAALYIEIPYTAGALSVDQLESIRKAGEEAAQRKLESLLGKMGMAFCRVLPFRRADIEMGLR